MPKAKKWTRRDKMLFAILYELIIMMPKAKKGIKKKGTQNLPCREQNQLVIVCRMRSTKDVIIIG